MPFTAYNPANCHLSSIYQTSSIVESFTAAAMLIEREVIDGIEMDDDAVKVD